MKYLSLLILLFIPILGTMAQSPINRIRFNNQDLFLSGSNAAWINFANDIGPDSELNIEGFRKTFADIHAGGGNSMRILLHTTGAHSPVFNAAGEVTGPGDGTIADVKALLDAAWEIFNEPEGMSNEFGWEFNEHVPMSDIQRFINLCAGAIHRTDPSVQVTNGSWSFLASTDVGEKNKNYYTDARLIEAGGDKDGFLDFYYPCNSYMNRCSRAGGDKDGFLDFYTVHYYDWAKEALSPFHHDASYWKLDKPVAITEFHPKTTFGVNELLLHDELYKRGYAGAQSWSWTDSNHDKMLANMKDVFSKYPKDIGIKK